MLKKSASAVASDDCGNHISCCAGALILFAIIICCKSRKKHVLREIYSYTFYTKDKFMDKITLKYYNAHAQDFVQGTVAVDFYITQDRFLAQLEKGASILDFGCGSGRFWL